mgnify:CR=1 FL=1
MSGLNWGWWYWILVLAMWVVLAGIGWAKEAQGKRKEAHEEQRKKAARAFGEERKFKL